MAIAVQALWASLLVLTGTYGDLFRRVIYTEWIFFAALAAGLLVLRRRPGYAASFRLPAAPLLVGAFAIASLAVVAAEVLRAPLDSAIGLGIVIAGLPVYLLWRPRASRLTPTQASGLRPQ
jgi:APA family basic amino acid/polyamine antiporter